MTTPPLRPRRRRSLLRAAAAALLSAAPLLVPVPAQAAPPEAPVLDRATADRFVRDHLARTG
ncbi:serine hydrolase, partial [Streptomyces albidoflavus]